MKFDRAYTCDEKKFYSHIINIKGMLYAEKIYIEIQRFKSTLETQDVLYAIETKPEAKKMTQAG